MRTVTRTVWGASACSRDGARGAWCFLPSTSQPTARAPSTDKMMATGSQAGRRARTITEVGLETASRAGNLVKGTPDQVGRRVDGVRDGIFHPKAVMMSATVC